MLCGIDLRKWEFFKILRDLVLRIGTKLTKLNSAKINARNEDYL